METLIKDVKWSLRMLRRQPGFAAMVIITLALGIGANTALFSVVNAVLLQPLPYHEPDRLVRVWSARPEDGVTHGTTSTLDLQDWFEQNASFEDIGGYPALHMRGFVLTGQDRPEEIATSPTSPKVSSKRSPRQPFTAARSSAAIMSMGAIPLSC